MRKRLRSSSPNRSEVQYIVSALRERQKMINQELSKTRKDILCYIDRYEKIIKNEELSHKISKLENQTDSSEIDSKLQADQKQFSPEDRLKINKITEHFMKDAFPYEKAKFLAEITISNESEHFKEMIIKQIDDINYLNSQNRTNK